ncbi:lactonase family protein [Aestuariispira insulae]|uniref:6-phosphogluconolactonase (Cycloisomerase 2 family) n=1 Tax=Aestuariispira insulae TaxID=1461337 RepID=A0A3D9HGL0_9PROT|nr:beta-propeller fold lactonase family protein [Aestuariispira insulae]RED48642.1 6-phosphogluconolactonase (cycloisomerase 2 family) [Aestuariispira insulae]
MKLIRLSGMATAVMVALSGLSAPALSNGNFIFMTNPDLAPSRDNGPQPHYSKIYGYSIDETTGAFTAVPGTPFASSDGARLLVIGPKADYAYTANYDDNNITTYSFDVSTGQLAILANSDSGGRGPSKLQFSPDGTTAIATNNITQSLAVFTIGSNGVLSQASGSPYALGGPPFSPKIHPTGKYVYVLANSHLYGYSLNAGTGGLTAINGMPMALEAGNNLVMDAAGDNLYIQAGYEKKGYVFSIDQANGEVSEVKDGRYAVAASGMVLSPSGNFAYAINFFNKSVPMIFKVDGTTGSLSTVDPGSVTFGYDPTYLTMSRDGSFLYVPDSQANVIHGYTVNQETGALTEITGSPFGTGGTFATRFTISPSGQYGYIGNAQSHNVSGYSINQSTGALTALHGSPFAIDAGAFYMTVYPQ